MTEYKIPCLEERSREANKSTQEKINDLVKEGNILGAQQLHYQKIMKEREGLIRL